MKTVVRSVFVWHSFSIGQGCGITCLCLPHLDMQQSFQWGFKKNADCGESKEITALVRCQLSLKSCVEGFGYYRKFIFDLCLSVFSLLCFTARVCLLPLQLNMFGPGGLWMVEVTLSRIKRRNQQSVLAVEKYVISNICQYRSNAPTAQMADPDSLNTNGKVHIHIHLTELLIWLLSCRP